jgi:hypothetical protein
MARGDRVIVSWARRCNGSTFGSGRVKGTCKATPSIRLAGTGHATMSPADRLECGQTGRVTLGYRLQANGDDWRDRWETVAIEQTMCRFGGVRNWFQCPHCVRRCELLYLRFGRFACRHCNRISYGSQSGGRYDRLLHKFHRLRRRFESGRPKGMHSRTWEQMIERVCDLENAVDSLLSARIEQLYLTAGLDPKEVPERGL